MQSQIDIQMPIRAGGFVVGDVLQSLIGQNIPFTLYIDASSDLTLPPQAEQLLELIATLPQEAGRIYKSSKAAYKRNKLRECGSNPYVYLADPDVRLPDAPLFEIAVEYLSAEPRIGAIGMCYHPQSEHVACGSMMLRRDDFLAVGELRGTGKTCVCGYITSRLQERGLSTVPVKRIRATHLRRQYQRGYPEYDEVRYTLAEDRVLPIDIIKQMIEKHGTQFKLFPSHAEEKS